MKMCTNCNTASLDEITNCKWCNNDIFYKVDDITREKAINYLKNTGWTIEPDSKWHYALYTEMCTHDNFDRVMALDWAHDDMFKKDADWARRNELTQYQRIVSIVSNVEDISYVEACEKIKNADY